MYFSYVLLLGTVSPLVDKVSDGIYVTYRTDSVKLVFDVDYSKTRSSIHISINVTLNYKYKE